MLDAYDLLQREGEAVQVLGALSGLAVYPLSVVGDGGCVFFLGCQGTTRRLGILMNAGAERGFELSTRRVTLGGEQLVLGMGEVNHANALALRARLPFTAPVRVGVRKSVGLGDRLGSATPGHIRALRRVRGIVPVLAQQSIREMERSERTPEQVLDEAMWGVFQEGWRNGYGADADHLKTEADIDSCAQAGFVTYTLDPGDYVDNDADSDGLDILLPKAEALPWKELGTTLAATRETYLGRTWDLGPTCRLRLTEEALLRAACKYGRAVAHLMKLYRHVIRVLGGRPHEVEVSVDETDTPTKPEEHFYIASELKRLGVEWVSLAPRYVGRFEKGVDYIGGLDRFEEAFTRHVAIARALGPYKLSLHSGSDKFSIYPIAARIAGNLVHLKTAGTSYLEALRAVARVDAELFRDIYRFAIANYERDRATYYVSGELCRLREPASLSDSDLVDLLDEFDARQVLHVTFGTVLTARDGRGAYRYRDRLLAVLEGDEEAHFTALEAHIAKHVLPFSD